MSGNNPRLRLIKEFRALQEDPPLGVDAAMDELCVEKWIATILGPESTPWEGGLFRVSMEFPPDYPTSPPHVQYRGVIPFHPNIYRDGKVCLDTLQKMWSPTYTAAAVLLILQQLLADPNATSPANAEAARLFVENRSAYDEKVREGVRESLQWLTEKNEAKVKKREREL